MMSMFFIVGLGNPGTEYEQTRHNTGAMALEAFRKSQEFPKWEFDRKRNALVSEGKMGTEKVLLVFPQTYMNKSGEALKNLPFATRNLQQGKKKTKEIANAAVIHDDLDIPFGSFKISFNKSSGGHKGVESIIRALKTQAFTRVRIGIAQSAVAVKKSQDDATVEKIILGKYTARQLVMLRKLSKRISEALVCLITEGREKTMSLYHS